MHLRFDWPVGTYAIVEQEWSRLQVTDRRRDSLHVRSTYRLRVLPHAKGRLVQADSFRVVAVGGNPGGPGNAAPMQQFLARLGSFQPSYVVSNEGEFLELQNLAQIKAWLDSLLAPVLSVVDSAPPELRALLTNAISPAMLNNSAAQEWNMLVGTWADARWEVGAAYGLTTEEPFPLLPGVMLSMNYEFSATERVPCTAVETAKRCVRLEMISEADSAGLRRVITDFLRRVAPREREAIAAMRDMRTGVELTVVSDPNGLRPYSLMMVKGVEMNMGPVQREPAGVGTRLDTRVVRFRYVR